MSEEMKDYENTLKNDNLDNSSNDPKGELSYHNYINNNEKKEESPYHFWSEQAAASNNLQQEAEEKTPEESEKSPYQESEIYNRYETVIEGTFKEEKEDNIEVKKSGTFKKILMGGALAIVFGIVASGSFIGVNAIYYGLNPNAASFSIHIGGSSANDKNKLNLIAINDSEKKIASTTVTGEVITQKTDVTDVVDKTMPSIVTITSTFTQNYNWFGQQGSEDYDGGGSGIIVGKNDTELLIATNNHVVENAKTISVTFIDNSKAEAVIKGRDSIADLAVISIPLKDISEESLNAIKIATLGDSENVKVGQMAIAIGNALGYGQSTTVGYISAKDREVSVSDKTMVLLQTDAAINPGNSGGALLNLKGEVVGINTVKYASSEVEGMGFAIPISRAMPIINELMNREILSEEDKGYLGVYIDDVTEEIAAFYNWPIGVYVKSTIDGGAAQKAGIVNGDIIVGVNDTEITSSAQLKEKVNSYRHGTEVKLNIMRSVNGEYVKQDIMVTLGKSSTLPVE